MSLSSSTRVSVTKPTAWLRFFTIAVLVLLAAQFFVGMLVNLFVVVPPIHPGANAGNYFVGVVQGVAWALVFSPLYLLVHVVLGLLLFIASLALLGFAIAAKRQAMIWTASFGLLGIMLAGFNGASFMNYGLDFSSLLMATGFLIAAVSYVIALNMLSQRRVDM